MMEQRIGKAISHIRLKVEPAFEAEFNRWYDEEHLAELVSKPRFLGARRFTTRDGDYRYLTMFQLTDEGALSSADYLSERTEPSAWTLTITPHMQFQRTIYRQLSPAKGALARQPNGAAAQSAPGSQPIGTALLQVVSMADPGWEDEFNRWYDQEHLPQLLSVPGFVSARRFVRSEDPAWKDPRYFIRGETEEQRGARYRQAAEGDFPCLAIYEVEDFSALRSPALQEVRANPTDWTKRIAEHARFSRAVYRQVSPARGAFESKAFAGRKEANPQPLP